MLRIISVKRKKWKIVLIQILFSGIYSQRILSSQRYFWKRIGVRIIITILSGFVGGYLNLSEKMSLCHKLQFSNPISFQPDGVYLWYYKLRLFDQPECISWNIKGLQHWVATIGTKKTKNYKRNWVFVTNSDFLIPISLHFNVGDLRYFKLSIILDQIMIVRNIKGLHHQIAKI